MGGGAGSLPHRGGYVTQRARDCASGSAGCDAAPRSGTSPFVHWALKGEKPASLVIVSRRTLTPALFCSAFL